MARAGGRRSELLCSSVVGSVQAALARLSDIWEALGIQEERRLERVEAVRAHTEQLLSCMISEEEAVQAEVERGIAGHREELRALGRELGLPEEGPAPPPGQRLLQQDKELRLRLEELRGQRDERLRELRRLQRRDQQLCAQLCATPHYLPSGAVPSAAQLRELQEQVRARGEERDRRAQEAGGLRRDIRGLRQESGEEPDTSGLEEDEEPEEASLTPDTLQALRDRRQQLQLRRDDLLAARERLRGQVRELRARLQEAGGPPAGGEGGLCAELRRWEAEVERLQARRRSQLQQLTLEVRAELQQYWDRCLYSAEQRAAFSAFRSQDYSEELLSQHDQALLDVKQHWERSRALLEAAERWRAAWARFMELEKRASDPNRFNNRGGSLLKAEKERGQAQKQLARQEDELRRDAEAWEAEQGQPFLLEGQRLLDYVAEQWQQHKLDKERDKQQRGAHKQASSTALKTPLKRAAGAGAHCPASKARKIGSAPAKHTYALCLQ